MIYDIVLFVQGDDIGGPRCGICLPNRKPPSVMIYHHVRRTHKQSAENWHIVAVVCLKGIHDDVADGSIRLNRAIGCDVGVGYNEFGVRDFHRYTIL